MKFIAGFISGIAFTIAWAYMTVEKKIVKVRW